MKHPGGTTIARTLLAGVGLLALTVPALAQELPSFRKGQWEFTRTVELSGQPKTTTSRKVCTDPVEDMRRGREQSAKAGCKLSDTSRAGNTYRYTMTCALKNGTITSKQVLTAQGDSAYTVRIDSEGTVGGKTTATKEELVAKRLGECP